MFGKKKKNLLFSLEKIAKLKQNRPKKKPP
jgi:hypothetical protein